VDVGSSRECALAVATENIEGSTGDEVVVCIERDVICALALIRELTV
jgi:hypothetical protein